MNWYDASADVKAANEKSAAEGRPLTDVPPAGLCFRPDDGTAFGRWRVVAEDMTAKTWAVWDMRRFDASRTQAVKVRGGMVDRTVALVYAELYAQWKTLRLAATVARTLAQTAKVLATIPAAWRDEDALDP